MKKDTADKRSLPFALPNVGSEEEEVIAVLSFVADELLEAHHRAVGRLRGQSSRYSTVAFLVALAGFALFLAQDFEVASFLQIVLLALLPLVALAVGVLLRSRFSDTARLAPPQLLRAQKLSWQWVAFPINGEKMLLWDSLTDEHVPLNLPPALPKRQDWLLRETQGPFRQLEDEKVLIRVLGDQLEAWQEPPRALQLPRLSGEHEPILALLKNLPRSRYLEPAATLPTPRTLDGVREELRQVMGLYRTHHIVGHHLSVWEGDLPRFQNNMERALREAMPKMDPPPAPPAAHPTADVETLLGTLDVVRSNAMEALRDTLLEELAKQEQELERQLKALEQDWERERKNVHYTNDTLISSLKRQMDDVKQRAQPEAEQALRESQLKVEEANERVNKAEIDLADKRKQLLLANTGSKDTPRASDERKRQMGSEIERLTSTLPEMKRTAKTMEEVVEFHRAALLRVQRQVDGLNQEYQQYVQGRDQELQRIDSSFEVRQGAVREAFAPTIKAIEGDLAFFEKSIDHFAQALDPFRADLIMENEAIRPYNQVVQQVYEIFSDKQQAVKQWAARVQALIRERREQVGQIVASVDEAVLPNIGVLNLRIMLLPIWYVETRRTLPALWPWERTGTEERSLLLAPFEESVEHGRRLALPDSNATPLLPLPALQARLDALMKGERRDAIQQAARRLGRTAPFEGSLLNAIAMPAQMPRAMIEMLQPLQRPLLPEMAEDAAEPKGERPTSDEFVYQAEGVGGDRRLARRPPQPAATSDAWEPEATTEGRPTTDDGRPTTTTTGTNATTDDGRPTTDDRRVPEAGAASDDDDRRPTTDGYRSGCGRATTDDRPRSYDRRTMDSPRVAMRRRQSPKSDERERTATQNAERRRANAAQHGTQTGFIPLLPNPKSEI